MSSEEGQQQLVADLSALYNNQHTSDVVFVVGQEETVFYAHKLFLWARCGSFHKYEQQFWRSRTSPGPLTFKYPHYQASVFSLVLGYIYSGKVALSEVLLFDVLSLANKLEVRSLAKECEEYVRNNINGSNACLFLTQASCDRENSTIERICNEYIMKHAAECVATPSWLALPKQAMVRLISSDAFCLEEEEVWRAVIRWAKHNANLPSDKEPAEWNAQDKQIISKVLDGVVEHVKFLLIDSEVFAQEVEPSGVVPIELSLERYRSAALSQPNTNPDHRLQPRVHMQYFHDSCLLPLELMHFQRILNDWYGDAKQSWSLLYRASRDGFAAADFHNHCDGFSPTFTIVKGTSGNLCGGFSDIAWSSNNSQQGRFYPSHRAFLFTLANNQDVPPTKFNVSNSKFATIHHSNYGPIFGAGADLCISDRCDAGMHSYSNLPHSYGIDETSSSESASIASCSLLMGDYNFTVQDYEVFTLMKPEQDQSM